MLQLHLPRHQHCADLQIRSRRLAPHPLEHLAPMLLPVLRQIEQKALVERSARSLRWPARVENFQEYMRLPICSECMLVRTYYITPQRMPHGMQKYGMICKNTACVSQVARSCKKQTKKQ